MSFFILENSIKLFYISLKYGTNDIHKQTIDCLRKANRIFGQKNSSYSSIIGIAVEISGRQLKTGLIKKHQSNSNLNKENGIFLDKDTVIILTSKKHYSYQTNHKIIYVNFSDYIEHLKPKDILKIGPKIQVQIRRIYDNHSIFCNVIKEGLLLSKMYMEIPLEKTFLTIHITKEEENDIKFAINTECDFIICPCPLKIHICDYIRWTMINKREIKILAKIHIHQNLIKSDIDDILRNFSGIYLVESNINDDVNEKRKSLKNYIIIACWWKQKILIRSGIIEILPPQSSSSRVPSSSSNNYEIFIKEHIEKSLKEYFLYPDCLIISQKLMKFTDYDIYQLKSKIKQIYTNLNDDTLKFCLNSYLRCKKSIEQIFLRHLITTVFFEKITCLIVISRTDKTTKFLSKYYPPIPIISIFKEFINAQINCIRKNVVPLLFYEPSIMNNWKDELIEMTNYSVQYAYNHNYINDTEPFIIVYDSKLNLDYADTFKIFTFEKMKASMKKIDFLILI